MTEDKLNDTAKLYEELRSIIDGGSESFTHVDAVQYLKDNLISQQWTPEDTAYRPGGLAQPEQEPMLEINPQKREWVGLTDDEVMILNRKSYDAQIGLLPLTFYRAIEAKLREKNS